MDKKKLREIDFMYLIKKVLYSWKIIFLFGMVSMMILTSLKYFNDIKTYSQDEMNNKEAKTLVKEVFSKEDIEAKEKQLSYEEREKLKTLEIVKEQYDLLNEYMRDSIAFNVDAYNNGVSHVHFYINMDDYESEIKDENHRNMIMMSLLKEYFSYVNTSDLPSQILKVSNINMKSQYLTETISISTSSFEQGVFVVSIYGKDEEQTKKLTDALKQVISEKEKIFSEGIAKHKLILVDEYYSVVMDNALIVRQNKLKEQEIQLSKEINELKQGLSKNQNIIYAYYCDLTVGDIQPDELTSKPSLNLKYVIIGFSVGGLLTVVVIVVIAILKGKLDTLETVEQTYDLNILGDISSDIKNQNVVDNVLTKIFEKKKKGYTERLDYFIENVKYICGNGNISNVLFVSTLIENEEFKQKLDNICEVLKKSNIQSEYEFGIYSDKFIKKIAEYDNIILVEKIDETKCEDLEKALMFCKMQKEVMGIVLV